MERIPGSVKQMGKRGYIIMTQKEESLFQGKDIDACLRRILIPEFFQIQFVTF